MMLKAINTTFSEEFLFEYQLACEEYMSTLNEGEEWSYRDMFEYAFETAILSNTK